MKPALEHLPKENEESFVVKYFDYPYYPTPWHYHPEYELVLVTESTGKRFIGDHFCNFEPGNLALIGPYVPHTYRNDDHLLSARFFIQGKVNCCSFFRILPGKRFYAAAGSKAGKKIIGSVFIRNRNNG